MNAGKSIDADVRILVVDDSVSARANTLNILKEIIPENQISFAVDGRHALQQASKATLSAHPTTLVLLDIEMPLMDGLQALDQLVKLRPAPRIVMSSALTRKGAAASMQALTKGACDYICKPTSSNLSSIEQFRHDLIEKVTYWCSVKSKSPFKQEKAKIDNKLEISNSEKSSIDRAEKTTTIKKITKSSDSSVNRTVSTSSIKKINHSKILNKSSPCQALAIGSSTGGPQVLMSIFSKIKKCNFPIFITQHMPPTFTTILAEQLSKVGVMKCIEATNDLVVQSGNAYLAPGTHHMLATKNGPVNSISLDDGKAVNFCRPAVDPMILSLANNYGSSLSVIILTGMGQDGLEGCRAAHALGANVVAQNEETSVVWGMPGVVSRAGIASKTLSIDEIVDFINQL